MLINLKRQKYKREQVKNSPKIFSRKTCFYKNTHLSVSKQNQQREVTDDLYQNARFSSLEHLVRSKIQHIF